MIPQALLMYLNNGLALEHVVQGHEEARFAADPDGFRAELVGAVVELLRNIFLKVDDHPTLSRFFTFEQCVQAMLLLALLDAAVHIFVLLTTQPRQENRNRLSKVLSWFAAPGAVQYLKRTCLGFEIVGPVMALASRKNKPGDVPVLVRLAQGRAHEKAQSQLTFLLRNLHRDPSLDHGAATSVLISTAVNVRIRFDQYLLNPFKSSLMVGKWNAQHDESILEFLSTSEDRLDVGYGLPLQRKAKARGCELEQVRYLKSPAVQRGMADVWEASASNSLDGERKHVRVKRNETSHVTHIGVASRNVILRDYARERSALAKDAQQKTAAYRKAMKTNVLSVARQRVPWLVDMPRSKINPAGQTGNEEAFSAWLADHRTEVEDPDLFPLGLGGVGEGARTFSFLTLGFGGHSIL